MVDLYDKVLESVAIQNCHFIAAFFHENLVRWNNVRFIDSLQAEAIMYREVLC